MEKLPDNSLLETWNNSRLKNINKYNNIFENKYLKLTNCFEIQNSIIIATRKIDDTHFISLVNKQLSQEDLSYSLYSFVIFNTDPDLPPEKSRISKYCIFTTKLFDSIDTIVNFKLNSILNTLNKCIDEKFYSLFNKNFKTVKYKLGNKQLVDILVKPESQYDIPSISDIMLSPESYSSTKSKKVVFSETTLSSKKTKKQPDVEISDTKELSHKKNMQSHINENKKKEETISLLRSKISQNIYSEDIDKILLSFEQSHRQEEGCSEIIL